MTDPSLTAPGQPITISSDTLLEILDGVIESVKQGHHLDDDKLVELLGLIKGTLTWQVRNETRLDRRWERMREWFDGADAIFDGEDDLLEDVRA
jgi:hypothetical protein